MRLCSVAVAPLLMAGPAAAVTVERRKLVTVAVHSLPVSLVSGEISVDVVLFRAGVV